MNLTCDSNGIERKVGIEKWGKMQYLESHQYSNLSSGAGNLWTGGGGARPTAQKSETRNKGLRWNWSVFFIPKTSVLQKKVFAEFGAFLSR